MKNKNFFQSVFDAAVGILSGIRRERNFKEYIFIVVLFSLLNVLCHVDKVAWLCMVIGAVGAFSAECFNTAVENICDMITEEKDERIKYIKDLAAGGVLYWGIFFFGSEFYFLFKGVF